MTHERRIPALGTAKARFAEILRREDMLGSPVSVSARQLTSEEVIGMPERTDLPVVTGLERMVEASVMGTKGHAFTDTPVEFVGRLTDVMALPLSTNGNRAIFLATLNATLSHLGMVDATVHCKDDDPERCALEIAKLLSARYSRRSIGLIGLNPAIAEELVKTFGADKVRITDRSIETIGETMFGVEIWDAETRTEDIVRLSDVILVTGTTMTNGTFDGIWNLSRSHKVKCIVYGVTAAGVCRLCDIERVCPYGATQTIKI